MDSPPQTVKQLLALWRGWSVQQRIAVGAGALLCVGTMIAVGLWASRPEFVTLADRLTPGQAAEIVSQLEASSIAYRLNFAGSAVLVSKSELNRARLCTKDVVVAAPQADTTWGDGLWADPSLNQARLLRDQELRLARSIEQMHAVQSATVHISRPQSSPFVRDRVPAKASVVLELKPGESFTAADAQGLVALLAHGVEGLDPQHVSIVDTSGRQFSSALGIDADIQGRLEYQQRLEASLAAKAEAVLNQVLGTGNAVVRVTAVVDFNSTTRTETTYDPDGAVKVSELRETETSSEGPKSAAGPPGTASNLASVSGRTTSPAPASKREKSQTTFENARVEDRLTEAPGRITRLTVAAVVHPPQDQASQPSPAPQPTELENLIKQAVGFDAQRQDQVTVLLAPAGARPAALPADVAPPAWAAYEKLIRLASLGIGGITALILGLLVVRRIRPVAVPAAPPDGVSLDVAHRLAELSQLVRQQPDLAARVVATWLHEEAPAPADRRTAA